jgi:hypothetical protein
MTTVQTMRIPVSGSRRGLRLAAGAALATLALALNACQDSRKALVPPEVLIAPYDTSNGEVLWAVAPLGNESGVSTVDTDLVADSLVSSIDEVRGIACLPLNRTIAAMRARNMPFIRTPADARLLAATLGIDALVVGNVTAYDPYNPPKLGLSLALYSRDRADSQPFDPMKLKGSYTDYGQITRSQFADRPAAVVSEHIDGANHEVQMALRRYAQGRHDASSALGWRSGLASMDLYTEFAANFAVSRLLEQERLRIGQPQDTRTTDANPEIRQP